MANIRQYIGARYVIKIYENSQDPSSAEWEQVNYEPLVMVTWQNGSYLSKKEVPATVGNPASNPNYWIQTGFYNGQIASLQAQIDSINNTTIPGINNSIDDIEDDITEINQKLSEVENKKYIFIGDSYGADGGSVPERWITLTARYMGLTENTDFWRAATGAIGFNSGGFLTALQGIENDIVDKNAITDIVVMGGYNDAGSTLDILVAAITSFCTYCKTTYPNALVHIGEIGWGTDDNVRKEIVNRVIPAYKQGAVINGGVYHDKLYYATHDYDNFIYNSGNYGIHPLDYTEVSYLIANALKGGDATFNKAARIDNDKFSTDLTGASFTSNTYMNQEMFGDVITLFMQLQMNLNNESIPKNSPFSLATIADNCGVFQPNDNYMSYIVDAIAIINSGGTTYDDIVRLSIDSNNTIRIIESEARTNVTSILIQTVHVTVPVPLG